MSVHIWEVSSSSDIDKPVAPADSALTTFMVSHTCNRAALQSRQRTKKRHDATFAFAFDLRILNDLLADNAARRTQPVDAALPGRGEGIDERNDRIEQEDEDIHHSQFRINHVLKSLSNRRLDPVQATKVMREAGHTDCIQSTIFLRRQSTERVQRNALRVCSKPFLNINSIGVCVENMIPFASELDT
jgi:hypothetical protein